MLYACDGYYSHLANNNPTIGYIIQSSYPWVDNVIFNIETLIC